MQIKPPMQLAIHECGEPRFFDPAPLRTMRKAFRLTQLELANLLGIHRTYLVLIEEGKKVPSPKLQRLIEEFVDKADKGLVEKVPGPFADLLPGFSSGGSARRVPMVSWAAVNEAKGYEDLTAQSDEYVETSSKDRDAFSVIVEGDSMEGRFLAGDRVVFAPNQEPRNGDAVLAKLTDGRVFFKWFHRSGPEGRRVKLSSENGNYAPIEFAREEMQFIYPALEVKRILRTG
jgi:SOS-response transcriptional repressor LexA